MVRIAFATFLMLHGLVHLGLAVAPRPEGPPNAIWSFFTTDSWLLAAAGAPAMRVVGLSLMGAATAIFVLAGVGLLASQPWWRGVALAAATASLVLLVLFWHRYLVVGVLLDVAVVAAVLVQWPALAPAGA